MPLLKRTPAGSIYSRADSDRLFLYFRGRKIYTKLRNTRVGLAMAEEHLNQLWREHEGLGRPQRPQKRTVGAAWEEFAAEWFMGKEPKTVTYYVTASKRLSMAAPLTADILTADMRKVHRDTALALSSRAIYIRAMRTFARWCMKRNYIGMVEPIKISVPAKWIETWSEDEITAIIRAAHAQDKEFGLLIELLVATGMRIHEALELEWWQIKPEYIELRSKDNKRIEPIARTPRVDAVLARVPRKQEKLFRWTLQSVSPLHKRLKACYAAAGVEDRGGFHVLRKTRLTQVIGSGMTPEMASRVMRASVGVAMKHYVAMDISRLKQAAIQADAFPLPSRSGDGGLRTTSKTRKSRQKQ